MGKKYLFVAAILLIATLSLGVQAKLTVAREPVSGSKSIELSVNYFVSERGQNHRLCWVPWKEAVEKRTNGRVKVTLYPGGSLGKQREAYDIAVTGRADISWGPHAGEVPLFRVLNLPFDLHSQRVATEVTKEFMRRFPKVCEEQHQYTKLLWMHSDESMPLYMVKKPVQNVEDLKGKRILCAGGEAAVLKAMGAAPIRMPNIGEWYLSLEKGVADGATLPTTPINALKVYEVAKYVTFPRWFGPGTFFVVMNSKTWVSLPPDIQEIVIDEGRNWIENQSAGSASIKNKMRESWKAKGVQFYELTPAERARWEKFYSHFYDEYVREMEKKGLPGKEFLGIVREIESKYKK